MQLKDIALFIKENSKEQLTSYYGELKENIKETNHSINKLYFWMTVTVVIYYLYKTSAISGLEFSIIKLENIKLLGLVTAPIFATMFLFNTLLVSRLSELIHFSKLIGFRIYNHGEVSRLDLMPSRYMGFSRLIQPFSLSQELAKDDASEKLNAVHIALRLPGAIVALVPLGFLFYSNYKLFYENLDSSMGIASVVYTTYINAYSVYRFCSKIWKEAKKAPLAENNTLMYIEDFYPYRQLNK
ncbi:hypothetical protein DHW03_15685 [Pedobacter yonginense]|uniref:Uncharacterized protein n=1 Tax=Pedobacter yonginense TaxID=651869 RepID=A0A317EI24_9SPHI|nr:hypothetical protein [Pedobacter yonginense]PWS26234.1 hypothetical protein DHW03_15685 [Pedobacter yonginense]